MTASTLVTDNQTCFRFKTSFSPCTILQVINYDLEQLTQQITTTVQRAPNFFLGSPVVIDLEAVNAIDGIDFNQFKQILLSNNLVPIGVRGGSERQLTAAVTAGIPLITVGMGNANPVASKPEEPPVAAPKNVATTKQLATKLVTTPIRSGMSVYAKEADLIVVASVSPGAELMADGNIHVYGALRGRALAGVRGNTQARIFCCTLEAELVAIAGYYLVKEDIQKNLLAQEATVQVFLEKEQVKIETV